MLFSSIPFLYYFLPAVLVCYFLVPKQGKNLVLLLFSLFFYFWGEPKYLILMLAVITAAFCFGLGLEKTRGTKAAKFLLALSVILNLSLLGYFKYADFFLDSFNAVLGTKVPLLKIALPIGISFYIFQALSYTVDVYRGDVSAQRSYIRLAAYIAMFPQLIAGPIVRYSDVAEQLSQRTHSIAKAAVGIRRFVLGLGKKVLLANALGLLCVTFRGSTEKSVLYFWLYAIGYTLQIYFDFSGYSDMAIGLAGIFGFTLVENFNYPYISGSVTEFWRRWHISLGSWFRDYLYIPLGGNRCSKPRWFLNILIVWLATGFWHGANWNFILWGLFFAAFLVLEKLWLLAPLKKAKIWNHIYVLILVIISFVMFNAADVTEGLQDIAAMFGGGSYPLVTGESVYYLRSYAGILIFGIVGSTPLPVLAVKRLGETAMGKKLLIVLEPVVLALLLLLVTASLVDGSFNPFLYFRF